MTLFPAGYVGIREAAAVLARSMFAGIPDPAIVTNARKKGFD